MGRIFNLIAVLSFAAGVALPAFAADRGTPEQAIALVKKAVAFYKDNGKDKAYAEFNRANGPFVDRDMYIFVIDMTGLEWANGVNQKIVGKNVIDLKDGEDKFMVRAMLEMGKSKGKGWVDYKWPNPVTKMVDAKTTYLEKIDDVIIAAGIYKQ